MNQESVDQILLRKFQIKKSENNSYTMRKLSRDMEVSPSYITQIFNGKKNPAFDKALKLATILSFTAKEKRDFLQLVLGRKFENKSIDQIISTKENKSNLWDVDELLTVEHQDIELSNLFDNWYYLALLELVSLKDFKKDYTWIATKLGINKKEVESALRGLFRLNLLSIEQDKWVKTNQKLRIPTDRSLFWVRNLHKQMIKKSVEILENHTLDQDFLKREISGLTLGVNPEKMPDAKKLIQEFKSKLSDLVEDEGASQVYQFNIQFYPLSK